MTRGRRRAGALLTALLLTGGLAACSGDEEAEIAAPQPTASPTPTPKPKPKPTHPLTGQSANLKGRVLVVKLDNTRPAHPHVGLGAADVVYVEQVEGGLTRLAAVFASKLPETVGPVRSARMADIELFAQYGKVAFAYSGAQGRVTSALRRSPLRLAVHGFGGGWFRGYGRAAPYNLFAKPRALLDAAKGSAKVKDVGFRFGPAADRMKKARGVSVAFRLANVGFRWSPAKKAWLWSMDGSPAGVVNGGQVSTDNVIVQYTDIYASNLRDVTGSATPFTETVGKGRAQFFRDGKVIAGTWKRGGKYQGTKWFVGKGKKKERYRMKPGNTWIVLAPDTTRARLS